MTVPTSESPAPSPTGEVRIAVTLRLAAKKPLATYVLLAVTVVMYGLQYLSTLLSPSGYDWPYILGGKINEFILAGQLWRLITPVFLHGGILHLAFNMYALYSIGTSLERYYGSQRFLTLYFIGGFAGNVLSFLLSQYPSLGASTAIFGLVAAELVFILKNKKMFGSKARSMLINLVLVILVNLSFGLGANSGIDNWGHLGGLAGGLIFAWLAGPIYMPRAIPAGGVELVDMKSKKDLLSGALLSGGIFSILTAVKFLIG